MEDTDKYQSVTQVRTVTKCQEYDLRMSKKRQLSCQNAIRNYSRKKDEPIEQVEKPEVEG